MIHLDEAKQVFAQRYDCAGRQIKSRDDVLAAVEKAYKDTMPRTIKGHGNLTREELDELREKAADRMIDYLGEDAPANAESFNGIHSRLCQEFLSDYNKLLTDRNLPRQAYGKAQKLVNMTFKYLSCFDDASDYKAWFAFCHMPIDQIILRWCKERGMFTGSASWTSLNEREYRAFQQHMRTWLEAEKPQINGQLLPTELLDAEIVLWNYLTEP